MNIETFIKELKNLNINPTEGQLAALEIYKNMLIEYNQKFNLTAIKTDAEIYLKHFYDSLTLSKAIDLDADLKLLDIGTGAGFPGLVLKIFFLKLQVTLLDSNNKKITFLNTVIKKLQLENITCIYNRAENLDTKYREYFDIITSRAVAHLRILLELSYPYLKINGYFLPMKAGINKELEESINTIKVLNGTLEDTISFHLPVESSERTILKIKKTAPTDSKYPRNYDKIIKKPL